MTVSSTGRARRRAPLALSLTILVLLVAAVASAYWRTTGAGSAAAATGTISAVTLSPGTPTDQLYPGGQSTVALTITNPNAGSVRVNSLVRDSGQGSNGFAVDGAHSGCNVAALSFTSSTNGGAGWTVAGSGNLSVTLTNALSMSTAAANACQGASFTVYLAAGP